MNDSSVRRRCAKALNAFHSMVYFTADLDDELGRFGVTDSMEVYLAGRAAPLGAVGAGTVVAAFNAFAVPMVAGYVPAVWRKVSPDDVLAARFRAVDRLLTRIFGAEPDMTDAAELAWRAIKDCPRPGRPMFSANLDVAVPTQPHVLLWHATTLCREHRGDGHLVVLGDAELTGLDALVTDCASPTGMPAELVRAKRGWTEEDWAQAQARLRDRGLLDAAGALTECGRKLRVDIESETDRLGRLPYEIIGDAGTRRLLDLVGGIVDRAAAAGVFPGILRDFFAPAH